MLNLSVDDVLSTTRAVRRRLDLDRPVEPELIADSRVGGRPSLGVELLPGCPGTWPRHLLDHHPPRLREGSGRHPRHHLRRRHAGRPPSRGLHQGEPTSTPPTDSRPNASSTGTTGDRRSCGEPTRSPKRVRCRRPQRLLLVLWRRENPRPLCPRGRTIRMVFFNSTGSELIVDDDREGGHDHGCRSEPHHCLHPR